MPELAEVRIQAEQVGLKATGRKLLSMEMMGGRFLKTPVEVKNLVLPLSVKSVISRGKTLFLEFENSEYCLYFTLGMSGGFGERDKHSGIKLTFSDSDLYFNDPRHFGTCKVFHQISLQGNPWLTAKGGIVV